MSTSIIYGSASKFTLIEIMLIHGAISMDRAEQLVFAPFEVVESAWLDSANLVGAFSSGDIAAC